ncbi:MAG: hypothetical protein HQK49_17495 [Oligoflexia bacterium]|nr:hypothetical protein [Oligoflexia bacterium]
MKYIKLICTLFVFYFFILIISVLGCDDFKNYLKDTNINLTKQQKYFLYLENCGSVYTENKKRKIAQKIVTDEEGNITDIVDNYSCELYFKYTKPSKNECPAYVLDKKKGEWNFYDCTKNKDSKNVKVNEYKLDKEDERKILIAELKRYLPFKKGATRLSQESCKRITSSGGRVSDRYDYIEGNHFKMKFIRIPKRIKELVYHRAGDDKEKNIPENSMNPENILIKNKNKDDEYILWPIYPEDTFHYKRVLELLKANKEKIIVDEMDAFTTASRSILVKDKDNFFSIKTSSNIVANKTDAMTRSDKYLRSSEAESIVKLTKLVHNNSSKNKTSKTSKTNLILQEEPFAASIKFKGPKYESLEKVRREKYIIKLMELKNDEDINKVERLNFLPALIKIKDVLYLVSKNEKNEVIKKALTLEKEQMKIIYDSNFGPTEITKVSNIDDYISEDKYNKTISGISEVWLNHKIVKKIEENSNVNLFAQIRPTKYEGFSKDIKSEGMVTRLMPEGFGSGRNTYIPGFVMNHPKHSVEVAHTYGNCRKSDFKCVKNFWIENYIKPLARSIAQLAFNHGIYMTSIHGQQFLMEIDEDQKPTSHIVVRDFIDGQIMSKLICNEKLNEIPTKMPHDESNLLTLPMEFVHSVFSPNLPVWAKDVTDKFIGVFYNELNLEIARLLGIGVEIVASAVVDGNQYDLTKLGLNDKNKIAKLHCGNNSSLQKCNDIDCSTFLNTNTTTSSNSNSPTLENCKNNDKDNGKNTLNIKGVLNNVLSSEHAKDKK